MNENENCAHRQNFVKRLEDGRVNRNRATHVRGTSTCVTVIRPLDTSTKIPHVHSLHYAAVLETHELEPQTEHNMLLVDEAPLVAIGGVRSWSLDGLAICSKRPWRGIDPSLLDKVHHARLGAGSKFLKRIYDRHGYTSLFRKPRHDLGPERGVTCLT